MNEIVFGLEAQGHIKTIERMLNETKAPVHVIWERIGDEIGWCPLTAAAYYIEHLSAELDKRHTAMSQAFQLCHNRADLDPGINKAASVLLVALPETPPQGDQK